MSIFSKINVHEYFFVQSPSPVNNKPFAAAFLFTPALISLCYFNLRNFTNKKRGKVDQRPVAEGADFSLTRERRESTQRPRKLRNSLQLSRAAGNK